jgi:hypothetical protein
MRLEEIERLPKERLVQERTPVQQIVNSLGYTQRWALPIGFWYSQIFIGLRKDFWNIELYCVQYIAGNPCFFLLFLL